MNNWQKYFFELCDVIANKSKDKSTKVGAIIVNNGNSIISTGYNGFPIGINDNIDKRHERPEKYLWTSHAEENAICFAARNGISLNNASLYVNRMIPCARCTRLIIQSGIKNIYVHYDIPEETKLRWKDDNQISFIMLNEANVNIQIFN